ncbi:hypothetical protein WJX84_010587 [Apatococcus fuscideae]|uniref:cellulase n=1 Tax=Apatococcus fuscideae TaxID=2026836 RepID=A0AAW1TGF2_9CHLO
MVSLLARPTASQNTTALADALIPALLAGNSPNATSTILPLLDGRTVSGTSNITRISAPASDSSTTPNRTVTGLTTTGTAGYSLSTCHWLVGPVSTEFVPTGLVRADYDYIALLNQSYFFYEAQRSGVLPPTNRSYSASGNLQYALDQLRWAADFLITAHISPQEYVAQVGSAALDHSYWGRPEDETFAQPAYVIDPTKPSSDLLGEAAAGLAAVSAVFKTSDLAFSAQCLSEAQALYEFGTAYLGKYSAYGIDQLYPSSNFYDDLSYGAAWLYRATGQQNYLTDAENYWNQAHGADGNQYYLVFNWDNAIWGTSCLLSALQPGVTTRYSTEIEGFLASWINGNNGITVTPKGLAWTTDWGSLRNSANAALIAMIYSNQVTNITLATQYRCWAQGQIRYMLGDTGRSFVVGFGQDPPSHESHRAASCPYPPATCGWDVYSNPAPNAHVLFGALIGGPSVTDNFTDVRSNYEQNEPALDIQAGYTGVLAAMMAPSVPAW